MRLRFLAKEGVIEELTGGDFSPLAGMPVDIDGVTYWPYRDKKEVIIEILSHSIPFFLLFLAGTFWYFVFCKIIEAYK